MLSTLKTSVANPTSHQRLLLSYPLPALFFHQESFEILAANPAAEELYGADPDVLVGASFLDLFSESHRLKFFNALHHSETKRFSVDGIQKGVRELTVEVHVAPVVEGLILLATIVDLTARVTTPLGAELEKYKAYIQNSTDGIFCQELINPVPIDMKPADLISAIRGNSYFSECNDAIARMYGFEKATELKGTMVDEMLDFSHPANEEYFHNFISNGFRVVNAESYEKDRLGNDKCFLNNAIGIVEDGFLKRVWGTQQDITERKKTEEQLRLLANLVEQTSDILTAADVNYYPVTWNSAAEKIYGITAEQALGHDLRNYISIHYTDATREEVRRTIAENGEWRGEVYFVRPTDKKTVHLWMYFKAMFNDTGRHLGYLVSAIDITERKEAESRLRESENRFREMADSSPVMIWMSDENEAITYLNKKWIDFTGRDLPSLKGATWAELVHKDDIAKAKAEYHKAFQARRRVTLSYRLLFADGTYHWVHDVSVPRFLADGTFIGYIGSVVDVQDQKEKEQQLLYQAMILDNVSDIVVTTDVDFKVISWNKIAEQYYEKDATDAVGKKLTELVEFTFYEATHEQVVESLLKKDSWSGEASFVTGSGEIRYFHYNLKAIYDEDHNKIGYLSTGRDITEKKLADEKMKKSEQFYRSLIADSLDGMILVDKEAKITFCSPSVRNVLGYEVEEVVGRNAFEFVHSEDILWAAQSFEKEVMERPEVKFIVIRLLKKDGHWLWCMVRGHNLLGNPAVNSIVVYFHDDTLRKQASEALKESEKKFRLLIRDLPVGVFLTDRNGNVLMCNKALSTVLTLTEEFIIGRHIYEIIADDVIDEKGVQIPMEDRPVLRAIQTRQPVKEFVVGVLHPVTRERCWIMVNADPMMDDKDEITHVVCSVMDLTERKKLETQLIADQIAHQKQLTQATIDGQEAERREIGKELHDNIGQQLTTIKLFLDLAKSTADDTTLEMVNMALKGVADLINEIRAMSRSLVPSTLQDLGLTESISELVDPIGKTQVIRFRLDYKGFKEDRLQHNQKLAIYRIVQEQLNNIVKHAHASHVSISLREVKGHAVLEIQDDGNGLDLKKLRKGLGIINIKNRAELLGGRSEFVSSPGKGCLLRVSLPFATTPDEGIVAIS